MAIEHIEWNRNGLCGAACAHMVLRARIPATPTTTAEQEAIWINIKDHTDGRSTLQCTGVVPEPYANMIRESCVGSVMCWETYPYPLKATLTALLGRGVSVAVRRTIHESTANGWIRSCLQRGGLPIVLIDRGAHWVVVDGWDENQPQPVSLLDPALGEPSVVDLDTWNIDRMVAVTCGKFNSKYVVVEVG